VNGVGDGLREIAVADRSARSRVPRQGLAASIQQERALPGTGLAGKVDMAASLALPEGERRAHIGHVS